ncbi:MAG: PadR family transcriptional regulator [Thermoanaerobaculia bacterium]|nr:PadR family transcriptional regulator [Thermoanaerobaculia bacterium]
MSSPVDDLLPLSATDLHVLLVLCGGALYGYAILQGVVEESDSRLRPDLGALYRGLARLTRAGLVREVEPPTNPPPSPGRPRRYYGITTLGRRVVEQELARLQSVLDLASTRLSVGNETR